MEANAEIEDESLTAAGRIVDGNRTVAVRTAGDSSGSV